MMSERMRLSFLPLLCKQDHARLLSLIAFLLVGALGVPGFNMQSNAALGQEAGPSDGVLQVDRAWDYRPYRVRVWICDDGSPEVNSRFDEIVDGVRRRSILADPSGWEFLVSRAPAPWRFRFRGQLGTPENLTGFEELPELEHDDKLILVDISKSGGFIECRVREFDLLTRQWSAFVKRDIADRNQLEGVIYEMAATAFMPIARVDRVDKNNNVFMRARAVNVCERVVFAEDGSLEMISNEASPVFVREQDRFLPIIRRTDRSGQISKLEPIGFTFVTINSLEGADIEGKIQSEQRAPLAGRTSKRAQKLALVIRPPEEKTILKLVSRDDEEYALEGFEIYSRRVGATKEEASEFLGFTDWKGEINVPPSEHGLRVLFVKRGSRALKKLPVMPGLYERVQTTMPNDEARLNAEGIIRGLQSEVLNLVAQREIYESQIDSAISENKLELARTILEKYQELPTVDQIRANMANDQSRLRVTAQSKKELTFINNMFEDLRTVISNSVVDSKEADLLQRIQGDQ